MNKKDEHREVLRTKFNKQVSIEHEPVLMVLRAHLLIENFLERFICLNIVRGDRLISKNFTFANKLTIVHALDVVPDSYIQSINQLNKIRNRFSHNMDSSISNSDVDRIGSPLGKPYTKIKHDNPQELDKIIYNILSWVCGYLAGLIYNKESSDVEEERHEQESDA